MAKKTRRPWQGMKWDELAWKIDAEGFDYFFCDYTSYPAFTDATLEQLAQEYVAAAKKLKDYLHKNGGMLE